MANIRDARSRLSQLIERALAGEEVLIARAGKPIVRLVPYSSKKKPRQLGQWHGKVRIETDFNELPAALGAAFRGERK